MEGVTAAIVAFLLVCVVFPTIVKKKPHYYAAFTAIGLVILLSGFEAVIQTGAFRALATFLIALLQVAALILLILAAGGLTWRQLRGDVTEAINTVRDEISREFAAHPPADAPGAVKPQPPETKPE